MENSTETDLEKTAEKSNESVWKYFKSIFPYLSVFIIILGLIKQGFYYLHFNVEIQNYIGLAELILSMTNIAIYTIVLVLGCLFLLWVIERNSNQWKKKQIEQNEKWWKIFDLEITLISVVLIIGLFIYSYLKNVVITLFPILLMLVFPIVRYFSRHIFKKLKIKNLNSILLIPLLVLTTISVVTAFSFQDVQNAENGEYVGTKIYTKDSTYVSDSKHFYIGKTTNYYFIFNKDRKSATIIPEREVNKFILNDNVLKSY